MVSECKDEGLLYGGGTNCSRNFKWSAFSYEVILHIDDDEGGGFPVGGVRLRCIHCFVLINCGATDVRECEEAGTGSYLFEGLFAGEVIHYKVVSFPNYKLNLTSN